MSTSCGEPQMHLKRICVHIDTFNDVYVHLHLVMCTFVRFFESERTDTFMIVYTRSHTLMCKYVHSGSTDETRSINSEGAWLFCS